MPLHRTISQSFVEVFGNLRYMGVAFSFSFLAFAVSLWLHNIVLIKTALFSPLFTVMDKILLLIRLLGGISTNVTTLSAVLIILLSLIFGINIAFLLYSVRHKSAATSMYATSSVAGGVLSAVFGTGCASCGVYLLGSAFTSLGASAVLALLPLGGQEFLLLSIALLAISVVWSAKSIQAANVCAVPVSSDNY